MVVQLESIHQENMLIYSATRVTDLSYHYPIQTNSTLCFASHCFSNAATQGLTAPPPPHHTTPHHTSSFSTPSNASFSFSSFSMAPLSISQLWPLYMRINDTWLEPSEAVRRCLSRDLVTDNVKILDAAKGDDQDTAMRDIISSTVFGQVERMAVLHCWFVLIRLRRVGSEDNDLSDACYTHFMTGQVTSKQKTRMRRGCILLAQLLIHHHEDNDSPTLFEDYLDKLHFPWSKIVDGLTDPQLFDDNCWDMLKSIDSSNAKEMLEEYGGRAQKLDEPRAQKRKKGDSERNDARPERTPRQRTKPPLYTDSFKVKPKSRPRTVRQALNTFIKQYRTTPLGRTIVDAVEAAGVSLRNKADNEEDCVILTQAAYDELKKKAERADVLAKDYDEYLRWKAERGHSNDDDENELPEEEKGEDGCQDSGTGKQHEPEGLHEVPLGQPGLYPDVDYLY